MLRRGDKGDRSGEARGGERCGGMEGRENGGSEVLPVFYSGQWKRLHSQRAMCGQLRNGGCGLGAMCGGAGGKEMRGRLCVEGWPSVGAVQLLNDAVGWRRGREVRVIIDDFNNPELQSVCY